MSANFYTYADSGLDSICDTKDAAIQEIMVYSAYGTEKLTPSQYWAHTVLHQTFDRPDDKYACESWRTIDDMEQTNAVQCNHRGDGKTSRSAAFVSRGLCFRLLEFVLYLQSTYEDAATEMDNVKQELLTNDFIVEVFGLMKPKQIDTDLQKTFGRRAWFLCNPHHPKIPKAERGEPFAFVLPRGANQRVRGRNILLRGKRIRPDATFADDIEDDEEVLNPDNRRKLKSWWFGAVEKAAPQHVAPDAKTWRWKKPADALYNWRPPFIRRFNGTYIHNDALIVTLLNSDAWKHVRTPMGKAVEIPQSDGTTRVVYKSLRPHIRTDAQLQAEADVARKNRYLDTFYREVLCEPSAKEFVCWTRDMFRYYTREMDAELQSDPETIRFVVVDPSKSASQQADLTGMIAVAVRPREGRVYVRRARALHLNSNQVPHAALEMCVETNSQMVFVEIIGQRGVTDINFTNSITKRGMPVQLFLLDRGHTPQGEYGVGRDAIKAWRAQQILPYYQDGDVYHHPDLQAMGGDEFTSGVVDSQSTLERTLLDFPEPEDWCFPDCLGYIPACLAELGVVFDKIERYKNIEQFPVMQAYEQMTQDIEDGTWMAVQ